MPGRLSIGEFSRMTHLSIRTLRRYHESGLLEPFEIDQDSSYRYYRAAQIPAAQTIRRFRELGMPVREIAELLNHDDPEARATLIAAHLARLEAQLEQTRSAVASLRRLLAPQESIAVELRDVPPRTVASIGSVVARDQVLDWYGRAMAEIDAALAVADLEPSGPRGGIYANELFTEDVGSALVYVPVPEPPETGRVTANELPPVRLALTVHHGSHADIDVTYGALGLWVDTHAWSIGGPVHEIYLVGPADSPDERDWRTEIGWVVAPETSEEDLTGSSIGTTVG